MQDTELILYTIYSMSPNCKNIHNHQTNVSIILQCKIKTPNYAKASTISTVCHIKITVNASHWQQIAIMIKKTNLWQNKINEIHQQMNEIN